MNMASVREEVDMFFYGTEGDDRCGILELAKHLAGRARSDLIDLVARTRGGS